MFYWGGFQVLPCFTRVDFRFYLALLGWISGFTLVLPCFTGVDIRFYLALLGWISDFTLLYWGGFQVLRFCTGVDFISSVHYWNMFEVYNFQPWAKDSRFSSSLME